MEKTSYRICCSRSKSKNIEFVGENPYTELCSTCRLGTELAEIIRISEPIKSHWAKERGLDLGQLLSDGPYKETYRKEMIIWSDKMRSTDPGFFCRAAIQKCMFFRNPFDEFV